MVKERDRVLVIAQLSGVIERTSGCVVPGAETSVVFLLYGASMGFGPRRHRRGSNCVAVDLTGSQRCQRRVYTGSGLNCARGKAGLE